MKITQAEDYGIRCVLYLAKYPRQVVPRWKIARAMDIPEPFLAKIAQDLARAGIIDIIRGRKGGYRLRIPPEELTLLQVVEAMTGELFLSPCVLDPRNCKRQPLCPVHLKWKELVEMVRNKLQQTTFAELVREEICLVDKRRKKAHHS
ncbi:MAG TPA: Rrf2 family transcriptional regulator [Thermosulfurimonas dismutans]|uniref:Rrf2 family transcriptional regulator n=1 Tax=Thermosulfurimonas dismutans TaxID=999894 RepID=A0A7C3CFS9_9BACT|nr:Rrf2 family transcriptional regulator [Thermosulfurimonas sp.]HFC97590.1 Rrf2 family transcriptional regulator [Thermosulfurimonas dismutans]